jgi:hypothetical protein
MSIWDWLQMGLALLFAGLWVALITAWIIAEVRLRRNPKRLRPTRVPDKNSKAA